MTNCPVCDHALCDNLCPDCGYDHSRNYVLFATFAPVPASLPAPRKREVPQEDVVHCSKCGGTSFFLRARTMLPVCYRCGTIFTPPRPETPEKPEIIEKPVELFKAPDLLQTPELAEPIMPQPEKQNMSNPFLSEKRSIFHFEKPAQFTADASPRKVFTKKPDQPAASPREISAMAVGFDHTAVLFSDGRVQAVGNNTFGQCDTSGWQDIVAIDAAKSITLGLDRTGFTHAACSEPMLQSKIHSWRNVAAIAVNPTTAAALHQDGSLSLAGDISYLQSMPQVHNPGGKIALGHRHLVLLSPNGTVTAYGDNSDGQCNTYDWKNIIAIAAGEAHTVGLKADGTVVAVGRNKDGQCRTGTILTPWKNVSTISAGDRHTVALRKDGTILCCGSNSVNNSDTRNWINIKTIAAGSLSIVAMNVEGKTLIAGWQPAGTADALTELLSS